MQSPGPGGNIAATSSARNDTRGSRSRGETSLLFAESGPLLNEDSLMAEPPHNCDNLSFPRTVTRRQEKGASTTRSTVIRTAKPGEVVRWMTGKVRRSGVDAVDRGLKTAEETRKVRPNSFETDFQLTTAPNTSPSCPQFSPYTQLLNADFSPRSRTGFMSSWLILVGSWVSGDP